MSITVERVAKELGEPKDFILRKGVSSFVDRELREVQLRIKELKEKYSVKSSEELEDLIKKGEVEEHPTWEKRIEWKNLEERKKKLKNLRESIGD